MILCYYETPLRRRGNLIYRVTYEIASVIILHRNNNAEKSLICKNIILFFFVAAG